MHFNTPGKYYVWARIFSTGTEFDEWMMIRQQKEPVDGPGPPPRVKQGSLTR